MLAGRLFGLCVGHHHAPGAHSQRWQSGLRASAELEHMKVLRTDDARGRILFRNGQPWSGHAVPVTIGQERGAARRVTVHDERQGVHAERDVVLGDIGLPDRWPGTRAVAEQGRSGLEAALDGTLTGQRPGYVGTVKDVHGQLYPAVYQLPAIAGADVRTTIDPAWQAIAKRALSNAHVREGAIVVLNIEDSDVLALASVDRSQPDRDVAVTAQTPGSVFKLITMAAALESYRFRTDSLFECFGRVDHPGVRMKCWTTHGRETLEQALAQSCDVAFAEVGMKVGRRAIDRIAERLHVPDQDVQTDRGRPLLPGAEAGAIFVRRGTDAGLLANTAIGQEDVRLSPLAAANLAATIARGGRHLEPRIVIEAERSGVVTRVYATPHADRSVSRATAASLQSAMRLAVTLPTGTAHWLAASRAQPAVKTGTAEVGGRQVNAWVTGYAPFDHPNIAFCVFVGRAESVSAHTEARELVQDVTEAYTQFFPASVIR